MAAPPSGDLVSRPPLGRVLHLGVALAFAAAVMALMAFGYGPVPALGPVLDPGHGAWASAAGGQPVRPQTLKLPGLAHPVAVAFTSHGVPSIRAADVPDAVLALGYLHARFRLTEMDLERRLGEGRVAALAGPAALATDEFELRLGLLRTAEREWAQMPKTGMAARALLAYSRGVNDYLAQARASGDWPSLFALTGVYPRDWTPVDSLAMQGVLTQELDFTTTPLDYALLERTLGAARTMAWFPVQSPVPQSPYDPGPYRKLPLVPIPGTPALASLARGAAAPAAPLSALTTAARAILAQTGALPAGLVHRYPDSNAWAANGPKVAGGKAMLAGDPHLPQTLPSIWYQVAMSAPGFDVSGVSAPGLPGIIIGHNQHIAWSLTDTQNQSTLFYTEQTSKRRPGEYFWRGAWRRMRQVHYTVAVRGGAAVHLTVDLTVHGPVMTQAGQTTSVDWMGNVPSDDLDAMFGVARASDFAQFRAALSGWLAPTQNFVYADDRGNIGAVSAGLYPVVRHGDPWLPMPGTGADDVAGTIPYRAVPQVYDPPSHMVATANQRPVGAAYPYYLGTTADFFDPGYRAGQIYASLRSGAHMRPASFAAIQLSLADPLSRQILPRLHQALLRQPPRTADEQVAANLLDSWNGVMSAGSPGATLWWTFWTDYVKAVFQPWWSAAKVPVRKDPPGLAVSPAQFSLDEVLQAWTLRDPANPAFTPPHGPRRDAYQVMRLAFGQAVAHLAKTLGGQPAGWAWQRVHSREFSSITQAPALGYGPRGAGGGPWTVDAADGGMVSHQGPSWRMIVRWTGHGAATGEGVYPGGQSENPASPWYTDQVEDWWKGRYLPMPAAVPGGAGPAVALRWSLRP